MEGFMAPRNLLLDHLPLDVYARIELDLQRVSLPRGQVVHSPGDPIRQLYFPVTCMISITIRMEDGRTVETGVIGRREAAGINAFMGGFETTQTEYVVQLPGDALKIAAAPFREEFSRNAEVRDLMLKYTQAMIAQVSQNVACNRLHDLDQRCARWLLEVRDRVDSDSFPLTQDFIAEMLGVHRPAVSLSAATLKGRGIIDYTRGKIKITDLAALAATSCECYSVLKKEYERLLGLRPMPMD
jgi:CRP-like cAMP-binding protein